MLLSVSYPLIFESSFSIFIAGLSDICAGNVIIQQNQFLLSGSIISMNLSAVVCRLNVPVLSIMRRRL